MFYNTPLDTVTKHKHLGIEINTHLTWKDYYKTICKNATTLRTLAALLQTDP